MQQEEVRVMEEEQESQKPNGIFSGGYWKEAARRLFEVKTLVFAALICALRIAVKALRIPLIPGGLSFSFDAYVNALGSLVYGPVVALAVGAISDTIGAILFPSGTYFFPFIFVEMSSSFIFALFFWKRKITVSRVLTAKFTVNFICNIILTSLVMKWMYAYLGTGKTYYLVNTARIAKNLVMFPLESMLIVVILNAFLPILKQMRFVQKGQEGLALKRKNVILLTGLTLLSVGLICLYVFVLKDFLAAHNVKFF